MNYNPAITAYISEAAADQIAILEQLRELIHESVEETTEAIKWGFPVFGKTKDYTYFRTTKKHVTFGFYNIDQLEDPDGLLEGSGNTLRHIKIKKLEDINQPLIKKWLKAVAI